MDTSTPAGLVEKRRQGGSEKRSNDGVERKRREKTLNGSPIEASLRGMVEVQSAISVARVSLQEAREKGEPWPFILSDKNGGMESHDHKVQWVSKAESGGKGHRKQRPMSRNLDLW